MELPHSGILRKKDPTYFPTVFLGFLIIYDVMLYLISPKPCFLTQNFSAIGYQKTVKAKQEATVAYSFMPADAFAGRPIGLSINLAYRDSEGNFYFDPVFNETVQIVEFDEGFDTEVFFMWVFIVAGALLVLFLGFTMLSGEVPFVIVFVFGILRN